MEIELCGYKVLIDDDDYDRVISHKWSVHDKSRHQTYLKRYEKNKRVLLHRFILGVTDKNLLVDHADGNTLNNKKSNLRIATVKQNSRNRKSINPSGFKGVTYHNKCRLWQSRICTDIKRISLGYYKTPDEAHAAYCEASKKYHGEFGRTE